MWKNRVWGFETSRIHQNLRSYSFMIQATNCRSFIVAFVFRVDASTWVVSSADVEALKSFVGRRYSLARRDHVNHLHLTVTTPCCPILPLLRSVTFNTSQPTLCREDSCRSMSRTLSQRLRDTATAAYVTTPSQIWTGNSAARNVKISTRRPRERGNTLRC